MGRQSLAGPVVFLCYYIIGIPLAWFLGSYHPGLGLGVTGLTIGIAAATWLHAGLYLIILCTTDWEVQIMNARDRLSAGTSTVKWMPVNSDDVDTDMKDSSFTIDSDSSNTEIVLSPVSTCYEEGQQLELINIQHIPNAHIDTIRKGVHDSSQSQ